MIGKRLIFLEKVAGMWRGGDGNVVDLSLKKLWECGGKVVGKR